jgi:hypothetical protein
MMNVGLNGFGRIGMYFVYLASTFNNLKLNNFDLFINEISPLEKKIDEYNSLGLLKGDVSKDSLVIGSSSFPWIESRKEQDFSQISWPKKMDCIIEAAVTCTSDALYLHNAPFVVMTGTPRGGKADYFAYNEGAKENFHGQRIISFGNDRSQIVGPIVKVIEELYPMGDFQVFTIREPYSAHSIDTGTRFDTLEGFSKAMPRFGRLVTEVLHFDKNYPVAEMALTYNAKGKEDEVIAEVYKRFPNIFRKHADYYLNARASIFPGVKMSPDFLAFRIEYHPFRLYTELLYKFVSSMDLKEERIERP